MYGENFLLQNGERNREIQAEPEPAGAGREDPQRQYEGRDEREQTSQSLKAKI
jgi:hypothetical protein